MQGAPEEVHNLARLGVTFLKGSRQLDQSLVPGHSYPRSLHGEHIVGQDYTLPLRSYALKMGIELAEGIWITRILKRDGVAVGAVGIDRWGQVLVFHSKAVILATGGAGQIYLNTDNAGGTTGDGYALAYELGLPLQNMEFVQFYPTASGRSGRVVVNDALVFLGATLRNSLGDDVLEKHGLNDPVMMTRDRLSRAIFEEILGSRDVKGGVVMDLTSIPANNREMAYHRLSAQILKDNGQIIVAPTCHFFMDGVKINQWAETGFEGLWAAGEVCSGVHGANRLGGNAFAEIFVFGAIAGREAAARARKVPLTEANRSDLDEALNDLKLMASFHGSETEKALRQEMKRTMWLRAGIIRDERELSKNLEKLSSLRNALHLVKAYEPRDLQCIIELRNMILVSDMISRAAITRTESRGSHQRSDYPHENNQDWLQNISASQYEHEMKLSKQPVKLHLFSNAEYLRDIN